MANAQAQKLRRLADELENGSLDKAVERLYSLSVDFPNLADPVCGYCGWQQHEHEEGGRMDDHEFKAGPEPGTPFFSEGFLYDLLGKDDARAVLAAVENVLHAVGVAEGDIR